MLQLQIICDKKHPKSPIQNCGNDLLEICSTLAKTMYCCLCWCLTWLSIPAPFSCTLGCWPVWSTSSFGHEGSPAAGGSRQGCQVATHCPEDSLWTSSIPPRKASAPSGWPLPYLLSSSVQKLLFAYIFSLRLGTTSSFAPRSLYLRLLYSPFLALFTSNVFE